ncbi:MAG: beta-hexosaminidase [Mogibacterium sp.]|nr:beta-hexosaminidase [Mogibacterium sp.]
MKTMICKIFRRTAALMTILMAIILLSAAAATPAFADSPEEQADRILAGMSTDQKIAQMMVVAMPASGAAKLQKEYQFGGYILFGRDFYRTNKKGMKKLIASIQKKSEIPALMGVDEEGGTVVRASLYSKYRKKKFRSPRQVYKSGGYEAITKDTKNKDRFLKSLGLNCNFGPVADVPYRKSNFMYDRSISTSTVRTKKFVRLAVTQMGNDGVLSALKHFPGYGGNGDTHSSIIRDKRSLKTFERRDLKPFAEGIKAGADMIMMSHVKVNAFDSKRPASLSKKVHKYLRNEMGFEGVIITDGLGMAGITDFAGGDPGKAAVMAVKAGNDMLCVTTSRKACFKAIKSAVKKGEISKAQLDASVRRILLMKIKRGIIPHSMP